MFVANRRLYSVKEVIVFEIPKHKATIGLCDTHIYIYIRCISSGKDAQKAIAKHTRKNCKGNKKCARLLHVGKQHHVGRMFFLIALLVILLSRSNHRENDLMRSIHQEKDLVSLRVAVVFVAEVVHHAQSWEIS